MKDPYGPDILNDPKRAGPRKRQCWTCRMPNGTCGAKKGRGLITPVLLDRSFVPQWAKDQFMASWAAAVPARRPMVLYRPREAARM